MAATRRNFLLLVTIENLYAFYNSATVLFGIVFFYKIFQNIILAILPLVIAHLAYAALVKYAAILCGKVGTKLTLYFSVLFFAISPVPVLLYQQSQNNLYLLLWFIVVYVAKLFFHVPNIYMYGQITNHDQRGSQVSLKRITITITQVITPLITGILLANWGFLSVVVVATLAIALSIGPISMLPDIRFEVSTRLRDMVRNRSIRKLWLLNLTTELHASGANRIWTIFLFLAVSQSYTDLGVLLTLTTAVAVVALYIFGKILDHRDRDTSFRNTSILIFFSNILRGLPGFPVVISDTYNKIAEGTHFTATEVINFDLMTDGLVDTEKDELVVAREIGIDTAIAISYIIAALLVVLVGYQVTFVIMGFAVLLLSRKFR